MKHTQIVLNEGNGKIINSLFNQWDKIKTEKEYNAWVKNIKNTNFGTYGTINIIEVLDRFSPKFKNDIIKKSFYNEINASL